MKKLIYIADDDANVRVIAQSFLQKEGYEVQVFESGDLLFEIFSEKPSDLVILDVMMPGNNGFVICTKLREISDVPIIMLTAKDTEEDYVSGISLGSDDYFTKPFSPVKLAMRVKAMFRRIDMTTPRNFAEEKITFGNLALFPKKRTVYANDQEINLTNKEFSVLEFLLKSPDKAVTRDELLTQIWGYETLVETRATDDTIKRLRRKLAAINCTVFIDTVWGQGFKITIKEAEK